MRPDAQTTAKPIAETSAEDVLAAAGRAASLGLRSKMPEKPAQAKKAGQENDPIEEEDLDDSVCGVCFRPAPTTNSALTQRLDDKSGDRTNLSPCNGAHSNMLVTK